MIKKQNLDKNKCVLCFKYQRYTVYYYIAFISLCIICYIFVQATTLQKKNREYYSSWAFNHFLTSKFKNITAIQIPRERKLVLLWTDYFSKSNWLPSTHELHCPVQECDVTSNQSLLTNSSAVILHWRNVNPDHLPPECPNSGNSSHENCPILVLFNKEAPPNTNVDLIRNLDNSIHLVASYRKDSDIYAPYGKIVKRSAHDDEGAFKMPEFKRTRRTVCWLVSHCQTQSNREVYANELKRYIDVDVYGKCGNLSCPHSEALDCYRWLSERCNFYLSFENSICRDYVTEKLYYALMADMVPIVMGGEDYAKSLPSHSYIDVADFASPAELAKYLKTLDGESYLAYFKWKEHFAADFVPFEWFCEVCARIHSTNSKDGKPRKNLITWWYEGAHCGSL